MNLRTPNGAVAPCSGVVRDEEWLVEPVDHTLDDETAEPAPSESHLELHFRAAFLELVKGLGATVKETPGPSTNIITATLGGARWMLEPQVLMHESKPDFVLTSSPNVPQVAIFCDGFTFHATNAPTRNRIADDAAKRANLRAASIHVLAITHADVDAYANHKSLSEPPWFSAHHANSVMPQFNYNTASLHTLVGGPFAWLASWIRQRALAPLSRLADALPFFLVSGPAHAQLTSTHDLATVAGSLLRGDGWPEATGSEASWWWQQGHLGAVVRWRGLNAIDIALVLDDRAEALDADGFRENWREWLRLSNWLGLRAPAAHTHILALSAIPGAVAARVDWAYGPGWTVAIDASYGKGADLGRALAGLGVVPPDLVGEELGSGVVAEFVWTHRRVVVVLDPRPGDGEEFAAEGWRLVPADPDAIRTALIETEG